LKGKKQVRTAVINDDVGYLGVYYCSSVSDEFFLSPSSKWSEVNIIPLGRAKAKAKAKQAATIPQCTKAYEMRQSYFPLSQDKLTIFGKRAGKEGLSKKEKRKIRGYLLKARVTPAIR